MSKKQISKKRSFLVAVVKQSEMVQTILIILGVSLAITADYLLARWECLVLFEKVVSEKIVLLMIANPLICLLVVVVGYFLIQFLADIFYGVRTGIKKLRAIHRYCFIPLTEAEVRKCGFTSSDEYINYILDELRYDSDNYVSVKDEDVTKILTVCIKVFPKDDLFKISADTIKRLYSYEQNTYIDAIQEITGFIDDYRDMDKHKILSKSVYIKDNNNVVLSFETKKELHEAVV